MPPQFVEYVNVKKQRNKKNVVFGNKHTLIAIFETANGIFTKKKKYESSSAKPCVFCGKKTNAKLFSHRDWMWPDGVVHYMKKHNIEPSAEFKDFIYGDLLTYLKKASSDKTLSKKTDANCIVKKGTKYAKLDRNSLLVMDALMVSGGGVPKYFGGGGTKTTDKMYSEHAGFLDFHNGSLRKISVSGAKNRIDSDDEKIFLPGDDPEMMDYEYIFHTHPPTPKPGGRANIGVMYELPSIGDIFHFIDHSNDGRVIGSIIIAPEGLYNIRKLNNCSKGRINIDESEMQKRYDKISAKIQREACHKYGTEFSNEHFYSVIAQQTPLAIDRINKVLGKYNLFVDFFPRKKSGTVWYIGTVFLRIDE